LSVFPAKDWVVEDARDMLLDVGIILQIPFSLLSYFYMISPLPYCFSDYVAFRMES